MPSLERIGLSATVIQKVMKRDLFTRTFQLGGLVILNIVVNVTDAPRKPKICILRCYKVPIVDVGDIKTSKYLQRKHSVHSSCIALNVYVGIDIKFVIVG